MRYSRTQIIEILEEYCHREQDRKILLIYLTDRESWIFISPDDLASAEEEYGDDMSETVYFATLISDEELIAQINAYFDKSVPETDK